MLALFFGLLGEVPGVLLVAGALSPRLGGGALPAALGICAAISIPLVVRLRVGLVPGAERGILGTTVAVFFAWWGACFVGAIAAPFAWLASRAVGAPGWEACAGALAVGAVAGASGATFRRTRPVLRRVEVAVPDLPAALDGYRIAQLSDLHMSGYTPPARVRRWVERVNALGAELVAITGDLITSGDAFVDEVGRVLGELRARDGVAMCMGNHDYFGDHRRLIAGLSARGVEVLRNHGRLAGDGTRYWLAGVDDTWSRLADPGRALEGRPDGVPAIVLAHDPSLFERCAALGATLVLSGHTHGGQVAVPLLGRFLNPARLASRYTAGLYRRGRSHLYVSRGAGTTGPPLRIGAPSEITLITLRRA